MGKPIVRDFSQEKGILKFFPYEGAACLVTQASVSSPDENGRKIVKAGTPFPSNDENCVGYLLHDVMLHREMPQEHTYIKERLTGLRLQDFQLQTRQDRQHQE